MSSAQRLILLREKLGFSQRDLAKEFDVSHGAIAQWEAGSRPVPGPINKLLELYEGEANQGDMLALPQKIQDASAFSIRNRVTETLVHQFVQLFAGSKGVVMKFAQLLSFIELGLPEQLRNEFGDLALHGQKMPFTKVRQIVNEQLKGNPEDIFAEFSVEPMAVTSLAQVHSARLHTGEDVVIKIQNPIIKDLLDKQFRNIEFMARIATLFAKQDSSLLEDIKTRIYGECDYREEARQQMRFRNYWENDSQVVIPKVFPEYSTDCVLTSELIRGVPLKVFSRVATQNQKNEAALTVHRFIARSLFENGWLYGDAHPSNMVFLQGKVAFLDFGRIVEYTPEKLRIERQLMYHFLVEDFDKAKKMHLHLDSVRHPETFNFNELWLFLDRQQTHYMRNLNFKFTRDHLIRLAMDARQFSGRKQLKMDKWFFWAFFTHNSAFGIFADLEAEAHWRAEVMKFLKPHVS
ncbi:AarF/UbiB family protein [Bdellovibrio sp. HCB288]|uniref:AarF/UbiB family protein n=1 Tax=Bdellovibrio sp. HCB288 TaxID=3394355 RepID=UPI0039B3F46A